MPRCAFLLLTLLLSTACGTEPSSPPAPLVGRYDMDGRWSGTPPVPKARPNIVVIVVDTLRADAVRPEREDGGDMPFLSGLARENVTFAQASSPSSWTVPALTSLLSGLLPSQHGLRDDATAPVRPAQLISLPEVLRATAGYQTAAFFGGIWPSLRSTLSQGFDETHDVFQLQGVESSLGDWVRRRRPDAPFFLLMHTYEAHDPYGQKNHPPLERPVVSEADVAALLALGETPAPDELVRRWLLDLPQRSLILTRPDLRRHQAPIYGYLWSGLRDAPNPTLTSELEAAYRTGTRWVDGLLERTFAELRHQGLLENTLWIVTSDHGEAFGEHGMLLHGRQLYDELVRIPLVMGGPAPFDRPLESLASVGLADLLPTLLDLIGLPPAQELEGRSFLPGLREGAPGHPVCSEVSRQATQTAGLSVAEVVAVRDAAWKYIGTLDRTQGTLTEEAYDLLSDPGERRNLAGADGLVRDLPFRADFCRAVERMRDLLWTHAVQMDHSARNSYGAGTLTVQAERPPTECGEGPR